MTSAPAELSAAPNRRVANVLHEWLARVGQPSQIAETNFKLSAQVVWVWNLQERKEGHQLLMGVE